MKWSKLFCAYLFIAALAGCSDDSSGKLACGDKPMPSDNCICEGEEWSCPNKCPESCPENCDESGKCPETPVQCPESCPDNCDESGNCSEDFVDCLESCPENCDEFGNCPEAPVECPESCPDNCDESGNCPEEPVECPEACPDNCDEFGNCLEAPVECSEACPDNCDEFGKCPEEPVECPEACPDNCDESGNCPGEHVQCPESCPNNCDENGACITKCGDETVQKIWFPYTELDLLKPGSTGQTDYSMALNFKTDKNEYTFEDFPCREDVVLEMLDPSIVTAAPDKDKLKTVKFTSVAPGSTTCVVSVKDQPGVTGTIKLHVLNLDVLHGDITEKNDKKYVHLLRTPFKLMFNAVSQGFDFYDINPEDYYDIKSLYFSQIGPNVKTNKVNGKKVKTTTLLKPHIYIIKTTGNNISKAMILKNAGHGQNLSVEHIGDQDYLWLANYNSMSKTGDTTYENSIYYSHTISRVPFKAGTAMFPDEVPENYYYSGKSGEYYFFLEPALDVKNNKFAFKSKKCALKTYLNNPGIRGKCVDEARETVRVYNLNEVKALETTKVKIPRPITSLDKNGNLKTSDVTAAVKDLANLKPLHEFEVKRLPIQGMEFENGIIYTIATVPYELEKKEGNGRYSYRSVIPIFTYTYDGETIGGTKAFQDNTINKNGKDEYVYFAGAGKKSKVFIKGTSCGSNNCHTKNNVKYCECERYFLDNAKLDAMFNYTEGGHKMKHIGYFEPEGIRVTDGKLYISLIVRYRKDNTDAIQRREAILIYDLLK